MLQGSSCHPQKHMLDSQGDDIVDEAQRNPSPINRSTVLCSLDTESGGGPIRSAGCSRKLSQTGAQARELEGQEAESGWYPNQRTGRTGSYTRLVPTPGNWKVGKLSQDEPKLENWQDRKHLWLTQMDVKPAELAQAAKPQHGCGYSWLSAILHANSWTLSSMVAFCGVCGVVTYL